MADVITSGFVNHNRGSLYWEAAGSGSPVVLVHGHTLDTRMWDDQIPVLAERHRVSRYDVRGYGKSSAPDGPYRNHEDLAALLDAHGVARAAIVGFSMGGGIASTFAVDQPERVSRLVLIDSALGGHKWSPEVFEVLDAPSRLARERGLEAAKEQWLQGAIFAGVRAHAPAMGRIRQMVRDWSGWRWLNADPQVGLDPPATTRLAELRMPVLCIVGEHDLSDFREIAERVEHEAPNARRLVVPGVGHMSTMEAPGAVNQALLQFLSRIRSPLSIATTSGAAPRRERPVATVPSPSGALWERARVRACHGRERGYARPTIGRRLPPAAASVGPCCP